MVAASTYKVGAMLMSIICKCHIYVKVTPENENNMATI
jgi:hypothetical protein